MSQKRGEHGRINEGVRGKEKKGRGKERIDEGKLGKERED